MKITDKMKTGWYFGEKYFVVKPLHNGHRQSLIMGAERCEGGRWNIVMGVFSSNTTYLSMTDSNVWKSPTSTNKNPSMKIIPIALEALSEIEQEIHRQANGKRAIIYVDGLDERRLRVYTKVLTKRCGYKLSKAMSEKADEMHQLYKVV